MTLDPVHVDGITDLVRSIGREVDDSEHDDIAERIWENFLDPLYDDATTPVLEPLDEIRRGAVATGDIAVIDPPFPTSHGIDAGTLNPTTFRNGVVMDIAQAAIGRVPTDIDRHRSRSIVATIHTGDATVAFRDEWVRYDEGTSRRRIFRAPDVDRYAEAVVHALALYRAEVAHAHWHLDHVDDVLFLDGPIYPKGILRWEDHHPSLKRQLSDAVLPRSIVTRYLRLIENCIESGRPLVGFVKNPRSKLITRTLRENDVGIRPPWSEDGTFFSRILGGDAGTHRLRFTNWFVSHGGTDGTFAGRADPLGVQRRLDSSAYAVAFFIVFDPRDRLVYRVETPHGIATDPERRERIRRHVLMEVAARRGPPEAIEKADELARISLDEKEAIRRRIETEWDSEVAGTYNERRWGLEV